MLLKMVREIKVWNVHQRDMNLIKFHLNFHEGTTPEASLRIQKSRSRGIRNLQKRPINQESYRQLLIFRAEDYF